MTSHCIKRLQGEGICNNSLRMRNSMHNKARKRNLKVRWRA